MVLVLVLFFFGFVLWISYMFHGIASLAFANSKSNPGEWPRLPQATLNSTSKK